MSKSQKSLSGFEQIRAAAREAIEAQCNQLGDALDSIIQRNDEALGASHPALQYGDYPAFEKSYQIGSPHWIEQRTFRQMHGEHSRFARQREDASPLLPLARQILETAQGAAEEAARELELSEATFADSWGLPNGGFYHRRVADRLQSEIERAGSGIDGVQRHGGTVPYRSLEPLVNLFSDKPRTPPSVKHTLQRTLIRAGNTFEQPEAPVQSL